jgi:hypothetical protein
MPFISENKLEEALVAAVKNPATAPAFYRLLLESDLLVLGTAGGHETADKRFSLEPGGQLQLVTGEKSDGQKFLPVFSSLARMQSYVKQEAKYLAINGRALFEITRGAPLVLNPASEYGKEISPQEIDHLLAPQTADEMEPHSAKTILGEADYPVALVGGLTALFRARPDVRTAWMIQVTFADRGLQPHPLIGIELDSAGGGDMASLVQQIERIAESAAPDMVFDVQRVDRDNPLGMADALLQAEPFYTHGPAVPGRLLN